MHHRMRAYDRDLIRGGHSGQRSREPRQQAEHMAAPTNAAGVKKTLANSEPSTHGTKRTCLDSPLFVRFRSKADITRRLASNGSVANDPYVWSGRALQEDFFELADLRSCINVSGL